MFKWFMAKTLITKIIIVTSSVVVIGGAAVGAIIIPKQIKKHNQEQLEMQQQEKEQDLANMSIKLSKEEIIIPLNGVTQGITIERYEKLDEVMPYEEGKILDKEKLTEVLKELFVESYSGGELTVDFDDNINGYTKTDYPITFTVTSEKGNKKSATAIISVQKRYWIIVHIDVDEPEKTIVKGTPVNIMEGVTISPPPPEDQLGEIKAEGTVDVNTVGTYTIKYNYIPKEGAEDVVCVDTDVTRTYKVIEKTETPEATSDTTKVKLNTPYYAHLDALVTKLVFISSSEYTMNNVFNGEDDKEDITRGKYIITDKNIILKSSAFGEKYILIDNNNMEWYLDPDFYGDDWDV